MVMEMEELWQRLSKSAPQGCSYDPPYIEPIDKSYCTGRGPHSLVLKATNNREPEYSSLQYLGP